jgi:predicted permease
MPAWFRRLRARLRYRRFDDDLRREIGEHRAMAEEAGRRDGLASGEVRARASRELGNVAIAREDARRIWIAPWLESVGQDLRYSLRSLRKSPGFTATALVTLGVGIGLNVSLFTVFNVVVLRPWDVRDPGSVVLPFARPVGNRGFVGAVPLAEFRYFRDHTQTLAGVAVWERGAGPLYYGSGPESVHIQLVGVGANFFDFLGVPTAEGRGFAAGEDTWGAPTQVAVVSHALWQRVFGGDPSLVGRVVRVGMDQVPVTVVGIAPRWFRGVAPGTPTDVYVPHSLIDRVDYPPGESNPVERLVLMAGRLKPGTSRAQAEAELNTLDRQFRQTWALEGNGLILTGTRPLDQPGRTDRFLPIFASFAGALLLVLLLACANVGNLQLARSLARGREIAVRLSLGAGRRRIVRQLLTEATCLSLAAGLVGFALAWIVPRLVLTLAGENEEGIVLVPDTTVFVFAVALGLATSILFALAPALGTTRASRPLIGAARMGVDRRGRRLRSTLLGAQIALSLTLLTGAALLTRGLIHVYDVDLGFDARETAFTYVRAPRNLPAGPSRDAFWANVDAALSQSGIESIGWMSNEPPLSDQCWCSPVRRPDESESWDRRALDRPLSPSAFGVLGLEFIAGGPYSGRAEPREAVINETLARSLFPDGTAVGRTVLAEPPVARATSERYTITGVVRDSHYAGPAEIAPIFHTAPVRRGNLMLVFRTDRPEVASRLRIALRSVDPLMDVSVTPVMATIEDALENRMVATGLAWAIGILGLSLAAVGVFGVFAYAVEERRQEIGVRLALGARSRDVVRAMFAINRWSVGGGVAGGLLLSAGAGFVLRGYLFGLSPLDPTAYAAVTVLLALAAALATILPTRRAIRIDPAVTLKAE